MPNERDACERYLLREIEQLDPDVIILLGNAPTSWITGKIGGITQLRGTLLNNERPYLLPTFHPSYILRNPGQRDILVSDLRNAFEIAALC